MTLLSKSKIVVRRHGVIIHPVRGRYNILGFRHTITSLIERKVYGVTIEGLQKDKPIPVEVRRHKKENKKKTPIKSKPVFITKLYGLGYEHDLEMHEPVM